MIKLRFSTKILLFTNSLVLIAAAMIAPIYAIYVKKIWWDLMDASVALWLFALAAWLVTLVSWNYVDKVKNKSLIIVLGYLLIWIWFILYTIADNIYFLFFIQILIWIWEAIYSPAFDALYWLSLKEEYKGFWWGLWEFMNYFTIAVWAFAGGIMVTYLGFNSIFIAMSILCFGSAIYLYIVSNRRNCAINVSENDLKYEKIKKWFKFFSK